MKPLSIDPISSQNAEHYTWGNSCDGWHLVKSDSLSIIQERMPSGTAEVKHYHHHARQFFFVLSGEASMEIDGKTVILKPNQGVEIPPLVAHQMRNDSDGELVFTVTSTPKSHGDRIVVL
ncbi:cupin domain-containing protein [Spirosoma sp. KNUC1025]|uniref:cupin domain-containing protein n=1 Tax=Spirosoma sp. KNUC1025 TaxID=2894082 RepID=UPI00386D9E8C|nr:cupin domain-containing protein [Spirosoma sp. KNUC1025]